MKDFTIIICALPGGGKGSQGQLLKKQLKANYIVTGDMIRKIRQQNSKLANEVNKRYNAGIPQPDEVIVKIFKKHIIDSINNSNNKRFIIDGFPRSLNQAIILENFTKKTKMSKPYLVYLDVDIKSVVERLSKRLFCNKCNTSYQPTHQEYQNKTCSKCNEKLIIRDQDKPEIVKTRITKEKHIVEQLILFYKEKNRLITVDGKPSIENVSKLIIKALLKKGIIND